MPDNSRLNILCERLVKVYLTSEERTELASELAQLIELREKMTKALEGRINDEQRKTFLKLLPSLKKKIQHLQVRLRADVQLRTCTDVSG